MDASLARIIKRISGIYLASGEKEELGQRQERYNIPDGSDPRYSSVQEMVDAVLEADAAVVRWILLARNSPYKKRYQSDKPTEVKSGAEIPAACVGCKTVLIQSEPGGDFVCGIKAPSLKQLQKYQKSNQNGYYFISCGRAYFSGISMQLYATEYIPDYTTESEIEIEGQSYTLHGALKAPQVYEDIVLAYAVSLLFKDGSDAGIAAHYNNIWERGREEIRSS